MYNKQVTFVTSYLKIYEEEYDNTKCFDKRLELFLRIADTGINICIFTSTEFQEIFEEICKKYDNIKLLSICSINELEFYKLGNTYSEISNLPENRSHIKDKQNYMYLMHSKISFIKKTIDINPFSTKYFCWFDFSLPYIFKNIDDSIQKINVISKRNYIDSFLTMPGCWYNIINDIDYLKNNITWRFCGGFFIGDKESLLKFYDLSINHFIEFLTQTNTLVWEVNYWAWLEANKGFNPIWYSGDHNDSIINIPSIVYTIKINELADEIISYNYPDINSDDVYFPSSASYIYDNINKKHIINTRYVNYFYRDDWECDFFNESRQIKTINVLSELNDEFKPESFNIIDVDETNLINNNNAFSIGLEDIRLYIENGRLKFIASNINYVSEGRNKIIIGDYNYHDKVCSNCEIVNMLWNSYCEKNWCPIQFNNGSNEPKKIIYKWRPFQVGFIDDNNIFQIHIEKELNDEVMNRFRGSSVFIERDENTLIGVVHYSVPGRPPIYYHSIVLLDKKSLLPIAYSDPFKFGNQAIEFCIGFTIHLNQYLFWISQMDREPLLIKIGIHKIPIVNKVA